MRYKYIYDPIALIEYKDAISWYIVRSESAAKNFVQEVTKQIEMLCTHPLRSRNLYKNFREVSIKKYPFCIVYMVDEKRRTIVITSVYHHKRNPNNKYEKK